MYEYVTKSPRAAGRMNRRHKYSHTPVVSGVDDLVEIFHNFSIQRAAAAAAAGARGGGADCASSEKSKLDDSFSAPVR